MHLHLCETLQTLSAGLLMKMLIFRVRCDHAAKHNAACRVIDGHL